MTILDPRLSPLLTNLAPQLSALRCVFLLVTHHGVSLAAEALPNLVEGDMVPSVRDTLIEAGFRVKVLQSRSWRTLSGLGSACPALAVLQDGQWVIVIQVLKTADGFFVAVLDPKKEDEGVKLIARADFEACWSGVLVLARRAPKLTSENQPFGLRWFIPELLHQKHLLGGVAAAAVIANLIAFAIPLLLQVLIDKVIAHQAWSTLGVVVTIFVVLATFDAGFTFVRHRLMTIAGGKVDARLGARAFAHLLSLPLSVFEKTAVGVLTRHMQ